MSVRQVVDRVGRNSVAASGGPGTRFAPACLGEASGLGTSAARAISKKVRTCDEDREFLYADASHELTTMERLFLAMAVLLAAVAASGSVIYIAHLLYVALRGAAAAG